MDRCRAPETEEGHYVLHEYRTVNWDAWRNAPPDERERASAAGEEFLETVEAVEDADAGDSATFAVVGDSADLLLIHLRPTLEGVEARSRAFEQTAMADYTEVVDSYVSVTEISGYLSPEYFEEEGSVDAGTERYLETRLHPSIPDADYVSFYPMDKRREPEQNWYTLPFEDRAEHLAAHGDIGKEYAGQVTQIISGSIGLDDWEWGVTLFAEDPVNIKDLLYEMRFDPSTAEFAEFGSFVVGRRLEPSALGDYLAGEPLGEAAGTTAETDEGAATDTGSEDAELIRDELREQGVYAGKPHGEDVHAVVLYSSADVETVADEVDDLRPNFEHYDTHVQTGVYAPEVGEGDVAIASLWETESAAETAAGFLAELPEVNEREGVGGDDSWGTMGMFYRVEPEHRETFVDAFADVLDMLSEMDGHRSSVLLANRDEPNDMFIASNWDSREDAMGFFRSDEFAETVDWGRDILADRPRHLFLA